jgi:hypothetical protein
MSIPDEHPYSAVPYDEGRLDVVNGSTLSVSALWASKGSGAEPELDASGNVIR